MDEAYDTADWWRKLIVALSGPFFSLAAGVLAALVFFGWDAGSAVSREFTGASLIASARLLSLQLNLSQLNGPLGLLLIITKLLLQSPFQGMLFCWILLNPALAIVNLLPLPALDGGQAISAVILGLVRRHQPRWFIPAQALERRTRTATLYLLLIFVVLLLVKDVLVTLWS